MASRTVFLTGASGVCGQAILDRAADVDFVCLVHREPVAADGVDSVRGDIVEPRLGLDAVTYESLAGRIDAIVHSAAVTNFAQRDEVIRPVNVAGTEHVLELAARAQVPVYHLSTAFVDWSHRPVMERPPTAYEQSKMDAEELVRASGLDAVILRPSAVMGDSRTGKIARFQGMYLLASAFLDGQVPVGPASGGTYLDLIPQDVVADVVLGVVRHEVRTGEFWVTAGDTALTMRELSEECVEYAHSVGRPIDRPKFVSTDMFERLIRPVFLPELPPRMRAVMTRVLDALTNFNVERPFPSSLPELQETLELGPLPDWRTSFRRSIEYWAAQTGYADGSRRRGG